MKRKNLKKPKSEGGGLGLRYHSDEKKVTIRIDLKLVGS
jgi:hypothetical protein